MWIKCWTTADFQISNWKQRRGEKVSVNNFLLSLKSYWKVLLGEGKRLKKFWFVGWERKQSFSLSSFVLQISSSWDNSIYKWKRRIEIELNHSIALMMFQVPIAESSSKVQIWTDVKKSHRLLQSRVGWENFCYLHTSIIMQIFARTVCHPHFPFVLNIILINWVIISDINYTNLNLIHFFVLCLLYLIS